ncbi:signal transduction histidine kinase [Bacillus mesophilus]|uniref:histidine kinase n=1 Tax=Bacillus mesophilus TaxID=1808955 RepID=A0A6M0QB06_9BACI|nr:HAMP domain-containing sensor histidine kinase [Bacillus mesophilus]MBM7663100.1 signal transduction histidine kinase [Bacillus mesophilus]NEY73581.1 HAMP domain-containing histidine kinase [Bacillus mesophilus]
MDIKLKNKQFIMFVIIGFLFFFGIAKLMPYSYSSLQHYKGSYFETDQFANQVVEFLLLFNLTTQSSNVTVDSFEVEERKEFFSSQLSEKTASILAEYEEKIAESNENNDKEAVDVLIKEQDEKITSLEKEFTKSDEEIEKIILEEKNSQLEEEMEFSQSRFKEEQRDFQYYIEDQDGKVYSNVKGKNETQLENESYYFQNFPYHTKSTDQLTEVNRMFITEGMSGYIAVSKTDQNYHGLLIEEMYDFIDEKKRFFLNFTLGIISLLSSVFLAFKVRKQIYILAKPFIALYVKTNIDLKFLIFGFTSFFLLLFIDAINDHFTGLLLFGITLVLWSGQLYLVNQKSSTLKEEWKNSWVLQQKEVLDRKLLNKPLFKILLLLTIAFLTGTSVVFFQYNSHPIFYFAFAGFIGLCLLVYVLKKLAYFQVILKASEDMTLGIDSKELIVKGKGPLADLASNLNKLKEGVRFSQKAQAKSERLKTELISNVSHDLRTPLTSIINYTGFLKNKGLSEDERDNYIEIIDRKSQRLKVLIDDLFEVSKMASGEIELNLEKVDIVQLVKQTMGEYDEQIKNSNLDFKVSSNQSKMYTMVDGGKMWRVFDNIISNILKYSLDHSRVYIKTEEVNNEIIITFKNISKYDLKENIDELFERFKRGDDSRHTEGSGLGLAIAKSIVDHHEGQLDIELDGDLFKTVVTLKK